MFTIHWLKQRAFFIGLVGVVASVLVYHTAQAYTYNSYSIDDLVVTHTDTSLGGTDNVTLTFTIPDDVTTGLNTSGSLYISVPYLYKYTNSTYTYDNVDVSTATASSSQLTLTSQSSSYINFVPKAKLNAGDTVTINLSGVKNPLTLEGTGSFTVSAYEYSSTGDYSNSIWGSSSQVYGTVDLSITMLDTDGVTPVPNTSVGLYYYNTSNYSDYEYQSGYTNNQGVIQFAGLTTDRNYTVSFYYSGTGTANSVPVTNTLTYAGNNQTQSYNFVQTNTLTHFLDQNGSPINRGYWYLYKTNSTNYTTDYEWRWGYTDTAGTIKSAIQLNGNYTLYVQEPNTYTYLSYSFTSNNGTITGLADPLRVPGPEVSGVVTAGGSAVADATLYLHNTDWSVYKTVTTDSAGAFSITVGTTGTYKLEMNSYNLPKGYFAPDTINVSVTAGVANAALSVSLVAATKTISGNIMAADGTAITDATIYAYQPSGNYRYVSANTTSSGAYSLPVTGGKWVLYLYQQQWPASWAYTGQTMNVSFSNDDSAETATVNPQVQLYNAHIAGRVLDPNGRPMGENAVYIYVQGGENNAVYSSDYVDSNGMFDIAVTEGTYTVTMYSINGSNNYSMPTIAAQTVAANTTANLGDTQLLLKTSRIQGHMTLRGNGQAVASQYLYAQRTTGSYDWASGSTDSTGFYDLLVGAGDWTVYTYVYGTTAEGKKIIYNGGALSVKVADNETITGQDFIADVADATVTFIAQDDSGNERNNEYGWMSLLQADAATGYGSSNVGCYVQRGTCSVDAASDIEYTIQYYSYSNWNWYDDDEENYSYSHLLIDDQQTDTFTAVSGATTNVTVVFTASTGTLAGQFLDTDGNPVSVNGYVYASGDNGQWASTTVEDQSSYTLKVAPGTWKIAYWIYGGWQSSYSKTTAVTVAENDTTIFDITALNANALISGTVLNPSGTAVTTPVFVKVSTTYGTEHTNTEEQYGFIEQTTYTNDKGKFSLTVPAGTYYVTAASPDYLSPQPIKVKADSVGSGSNVQLGFINPAASIIGTVTDGVGITINAQHILAQGDGVADAFVYAYCIGGSYSTATADTTGAYVLAVPVDDTCFVGAVSQSNNTAYYSEQSTVSTDEIEISQSISLTNSLTLPASQTTNFDPTEGTVVALENGVRVEIPANTMNVSADITSVTIVITPVAEVVHQPGVEPITIGYNFTATDQAGNPITQFGGDVKIIIPYDQADLTDAGVTEDEVQANYFQEAANTWQAIDGGVIKNETDDQFEISVQHFSTFAVVSNRSVLAVTDDNNDNDADTGDGGDDSDSDGGGNDNDSGNSDNDAVTIEQGILTAPTKVLIAKRSANGLQARWKHIAAADHYEVQLINVTKDTIAKKVSTQKVNQLVEDLLSNQPYQVRVRSVGSNNSTSGWSTMVSTRTKPAIPIHLTASELTSVSAHLRWSKPRGKITSYTVTVYNQSGNKVVQTTTRKPQLTLATLQSNITYSFRVQARLNKHNVSQLSKAKQFHTAE
ncbi:MAG: fibronectin type III domain-containing protein [Candidatus Kerfeldbacteria bacterium]|nr:fibronectin type III domain-containing protein [Candidatus Kerfeldbacteria bacterium]